MLGYNLNVLISYDTVAYIMQRILNEKEVK